MINSTNFQSLSELLDGELCTDTIHRVIYSTDASAYRQSPLAVAYPKNVDDIIKIVDFARKHKISIVPRTAGTSLAGQVVGDGIIVDVSKHFTNIVELNVQEKWIRLQPGIVLDELNKYLEPHNLFFGPETSTSNRCMIGGMVGNNACGSHSILYGSTRDHLLEVKAILSDGSEVEFSSLTNEEFEQKCNGALLENKLYRTINEILNNQKNQQEIREQYPDKNLKRRNTGYAIDLLLETEPFTPNAEPFNFCKIIAGSEGTLAFTTEIKLKLVPLPPKVKGVMAVHFHTMEEALKANLIALKYQPGAVEMMDKTILDLTKGNIEQQKNRFFLDGNPEAILIIEFARETKEEIDEIVSKMEAELRSLNFGFHYPVIWGKDISKIWNLRKSGLGVLSNMKGDAKPVSLIEDTAVHVEKMPDYIAEFKLLMVKYNLSCVYHAHIGSGELHLRPVLDLKLPGDVEIFRSLALDVAKLVKKYKGSLSGEHGDGRLRGEFIPLMVGEHNYQLLKQIKQSFDPECIFNPGKITDTPAMNTSLRYEVGEPTKEIESVFDFSNEMGMMRAVEKCNGAGDCRKSEIMGGIMCPSFMATRDEQNSTRARANILREYLIHSPKKNPFDHEEIYKVMDLCLSCKGCKSECPSNVDMTKIKAEFLQHYYDANGVPLRSLLVANISKINRLGSLMPGLTNFFLSKPAFTSILGFSKERQLPLLAKQTFRNWYNKKYKTLLSAEPVQPTKSVYLFCDEFTIYNDVEIGKTTVKLLLRLGYNVLLTKHDESGRTYLSKGLVRKARDIAEKNVLLLKDLVTDEVPLVGIEPSAILTFRDEYPELVNATLRNEAYLLAKNCFLIDEFLVKENETGRINLDLFTDNEQTIKLHCHCQQKSIASSQSTLSMLSFPKNYHVSEIPSGCCGMAGSFGYEKEHYEISQKIGELVLFKQIEKTPISTILAAQGTSCRHQIKDGTKRTALHPVEILYGALKN
jgi:FAD/FMN-containing dehydrogenase/Fe-S oxidoreductase